MKNRNKQILLSIFAALLLLSLGVACGENDERTPEPALVECTWDQSPLDWDEEAPNGMVAETILEDLDAEKAQEISGKDPKGKELLFTVEFQRRGDGPIFYTQKEGSCGDKLVIPATFTLKSDDGRLDEEFEVEAEVQDKALRIYKGLKEEDIQGSFEPTLADGESLIGLFLEADINESGLSGTFGTRVETRSGSGSDGSVSAGPGEVFMF